MLELTLAEFLALVQGQRGHFQLESGYHSGLWLDLDGLFARPKKIAPFVARLSQQLQRHRIDVVCGPLLGGALLAQSVAIVLGTEFCFTQPAEPAGAAGLYQARYRLPSSFRTRVRGRRVAIIDDVMSAGSSLRATITELQSYEAIPAVVGALLILGDVGTRYFREERLLPVEAVVQDAFELWPPSDCPLCGQGAPLEDRTAAAEIDASTHR